MHWQCPAALAALGICYKLVKAVCLQTTLIYPRVSVRHSTNHRSRKRLSWFLLFSPNPQMYFVLSDNGRSTEPEAGTPGQCKHCGKPVCGSSWLWVSGKQRQGMTKGKGNRKRAKRTTHNAMFGTKTCCCFSKAAVLLLETGDTHCPQIAHWSWRASMLVWMTAHYLLLGCTPQYCFWAKAVKLCTI